MVHWLFLRFPSYETNSEGEEIMEFEDTFIIIRIISSVSPCYKENYRDKNVATPIFSASFVRDLPFKSFPNCFLKSEKATDTLLSKWLMFTVPRILSFHRYDFVYFIVYKGQNILM